PTTVGYAGAAHDAGAAARYRDTRHIAWRPHVRACLCRRIATIGGGRAPVVAAVTARRHVAVVAPDEVLLAVPERVAVREGRPVERVVLCRDDLPLGVGLAGHVAIGVDHPRPRAHVRIRHRDLSTEPVKIDRRDVALHVFDLAHAPEHIRLQLRYAE